jgi:hypothetical protein
VQPSSTHLRCLARALTLRAALIAPCLAAACDEAKPPSFSYYDDRIAPIVGVGCVQQTTGCHLANAQQAAVGNLDLSSYDALIRRDDALVASGPYPVGQLLLKGGDAVQIPVQTFDAPDPSHPNDRFVAITTDIRHAGGTLLRVGSDGYAQLKSWISQGYHRDGSLEEKLNVSQGSCSSGPGSHAGFDPSQAPADAASFRDFVRHVQPVLHERCAGGYCHGSKIADLYLSCGETEAEQRWNYFAALSHLDPTTSLSELLRRPLSKQRGGTFHEGGTIFPDTEDPGYEALRSWAQKIADDKPELITYQPTDEGLRFYGNYVQPVLVKKGCMFGNCHSPSMFHDLRLRTGSQGTFSRIAMDRNYEFAKLQLALESANPNDSRIIAKNLFPPDKGGTGLTHRGGSLFEDFADPATPEDCAGVDVTATPLDRVPAYCVLVAWHKLERDRAIADGSIEPGPGYALVWVSRPLGVGDARDFDRYRPGADLIRAELTLDADGKPSLGPQASLLEGCGLDAKSADVRGPAVSWDGKKLAFAARSSASRPLRLFEVDVDGTGCAPIAGVAAAREQENGILIHDFDPAFAPDGRLVFASTRGNLVGGFSYDGPQRTPSQLAPNANLYVWDPKAKSLRQLTFLLNQELEPSFMADGRLLFTSEKRAPEFFQLAGRRMNLDGGDYHPLIAQRRSLGFELATEIIELTNRDFALVAAPFGAVDGAGGIALVNRSIGPDQDDRDPKDKFYLHSVTYPAPGALDGGRGAYRSPARLPSSWLVVSCDPDAKDLTRGPFDFDLCALDPRDGKLEHLGGEAGRAEIEAVAVYARLDRGVFQSRQDEVNANTRVVPHASDAEVHVADFPLLATLLFANTRTGRPIDTRVAGLDVLESFPPPADVTDFAKLPAGAVTKDDFGSVFTHYESLGTGVLEADGSIKIRVDGGHPILLVAADAQGKPLEFAAGAPFTGEMVQREEMQFYPGERSNVSFRRELFNGMCGGCHGSITGYELDIGVDVDVLTQASRTIAKSKASLDLRR